MRRIAGIWACRSVDKPHTIRSQSTFEGADARIGIRDGSPLRHLVVIGRVQVLVPLNQGVAQGRSRIVDKTNYVMWSRGSTGRCTGVFQKE